MVDLPIDYTSRDYTSIRQDMIDQISQRLPEWTSRSPNDMGIVLLEMFAHVADGMHYYADRVANESFLSTATQRSSVLEIAKLLDYQPTGNLGATVDLTFLNQTGATVVVPKRTRVGTLTARTPPSPGPGRAYLRPSAAAVVFETDADLSVPANNSAVISAHEGISVVGEAVANSDGTADQDWDLYYAPVIQDSVVVYVNGATQTRFEHIIDADFATPAYNITVDAAGYTHITFGDDINGAIPASGAAITADYRVGGGSVGNVVAQSLQRILTTVPAGVTVNNFTDAAGGADAESISSIKINAPRSLYTLDRAVSAADYAQLALKVPGVGKAILAPQSTYNSAVIYIAPSGGKGLSDPNGYTGAPTAAWNTLRDNVYTYMVDRIPASTTLTILPPTYVTINGIFNVVVSKNFPLEATRLSCYPAIAKLLQFDNVVFGDTISEGDFLSAILSVPGIKQASISTLAPNSPDAGQILLDTFDTLPTGSGWTEDASVSVDGGGSISRTTGVGTASRTIASADLSGTGEITLRFTWDGGVGGLVGTLTLTDVNGHTYAAGSRHWGIAAGTIAHTNWLSLRWEAISWPPDSTIFDPTQVVSYSLTVTPTGAAIPKFWIDDLRAIPFLIEDISLAYNQIPTDGGDTLSVFTVYATRG